MTTGRINQVNIDVFKFLPTHAHTPTRKLVAHISEEKNRYKQTASNDRVNSIFQHHPLICLFLTKILNTKNIKIVNAQHNLSIALNNSQSEQFHFTKSVFPELNNA